MEHVIFDDHNSNMAGSDWKTFIWLRRTKRNGYSLHAKVISNDDDNPVSRLPAARNLRSAAEIYEATVVALAWAQIEADANILDGIAQKIASFDADLAKNFKQAPAIIEAGQEQEAERLATERAAALAPFLNDIDRLCPFPKNPDSRVGGGFTERMAYGIRKRRLEEFILMHGHLPGHGQPW